MPYSHTNSKGVLFHLNAKEVMLRGGRPHTIYFFSKEERPQTSVDLPDTHEVRENANNGMLVLKRKDQ